MNEIPYFQLVSENISTGGQPSVDHLKALKAQGYTGIVNLTPKSQGDVAQQLGMLYAHIPIDCSNLQPEQYLLFKSMVEGFTAAAGSKVFVHCGMNIKSSGMMHIYRQQVLGQSKDLSEDALKSTPGHEPKWRDFWTRMGV